MTRTELEEKKEKEKKRKIWGNAAKIGAALASIAIAILTKGNKA